MHRNFSVTAGGTYIAFVFRGGCYDEIDGSVSRKWSRPTINYYHVVYIGELRKTKNLKPSPCLYSKQHLTNTVLKNVVKISTATSVRFLLLSPHENGFDLGCDGAKGGSDPF